MIITLTQALAQGAGSGGEAGALQQFSVLTCMLIHASAMLHCPCGAGKASLVLDCSFRIFSLGEILTDGEYYCSNSRKVVASCEQFYRDTISTFMDPFLLRANIFQEMTSLWWEAGCLLRTCDSHLVPW